jgi:hypothetical protein
MTMIGHAGGMSENAGSRIILLPGGTSAGPTSVAEDAHSTGVAPGGSAKPDYSATGSTAVAYDGAVPRPADVDGGTNSGPTVAETLRRRIVISTTSAEDQRYLELPAKPGDVILIPAAGEVTVQGWVDKPGAFPVTPGMTVLSSIAAAGGSLFSNYATLLREQYGGRKLDLSLDLTRLKNGTEQDVQVQSGDVIVVERSMAGAVPYSLYFLVQKVGIGLPLIPAF